MKLRWYHYLSAALLLAVALTVGSALAAQPGDKDAPAAPGSALVGTLQVVWGDPQPGSGGAPQTLFYLVDDAGNRARLTIAPEALAAAGGIPALSGRRVLVGGETTAAPGDDGLPTIAATTVELAPGQAPGPDPISGSQPYVSILCKFNDIPDQPRGLAYFRNMYANTYPGLDHYWRETSFNTVNIAGSNAYGWFTLPRPRSAYFDANGNLLHWDILVDCVGVADASVYFPAFTGINMMFNDVLDCCAWGGTGWQLTLDGVTKPYGITWEPPWGYNEIGVMAHEMGHSMGMPHSSGQYGYVYDNRWDVMSDIWSDCGRATHATYGCLGQGTISFHKDLVGWVPAARKFTLGNAAQTVTLARLVNPGASGYLMAVIPIDGSDHYYTVEARKQVGYDQKLPREGVVIHEVINNYAYVIDADWNGDTGDAGAQWLPGETFYGLNSITVTVDGGTTAGYTVTLTPAVEVTDPHEPNNRRADATRISYGQVIDDALIDPAGDVDVYRFTGAAGDTVEVDIDARMFGSQLDSVVELMASDGTVLAYNDDDGESLDSYLVYTLAAPGNYYVKVRDYSHPNEGGSGYFYTLQVNTIDAPLTADVFVTTTGVGTTADGVSFDKRDILHWNSTWGYWTRYLDGSALGLPTKADIVAIDIPGGVFPAANMAFAAPITVAGAGKITAHDLLLYDENGFTQRFDGSDVGLTLSGEKLDAFDILRGSVSPIWSGCERYILFSTRGNGSVKDVNNANLSFAGEDVLGFCATQLGSTTTGKWHKVMDGSNEGLPAGATFSLAAGEDGQLIYLTTTGPFNTDGIAGNHSMIYVFDLATGQLSGPIWSAPDAGLPVKVDGMELKPYP